MLLFITVNCINLVISLWDFAQWSWGRGFVYLLFHCPCNTFSSSSSSIQNFTSLLFPFFIPTFSVSSSQCKTISCQHRLYLYYQSPLTLLLDTNYVPSPFANENVCFHLPFRKECTLVCLFLQYTHDILKVFHFGAMWEWFYFAFQENG